MQFGHKVGDCFLSKDKDSNSQFQQSGEPPRQRPIEMYSSDGSKNKLVAKLAVTPDVHPNQRENYDTKSAHACNTMRRFRNASLRR